MIKIKEKLENIVWNIKAVLHQPIVHKVNLQYVLDKNLSWSCSTDKWCYYWEGDFKTGKEVKVSRIEYLEWERNRLETKIYELEYELNEFKKRTSNRR